MKTFRQFAAALTIFCLGASASPEPSNLIKNPDFEQRASDQQPAEFSLSGDVTYRYLGDYSRDASSWGVAMQSAKPASSGTVSQVVKNIDSKNGRWFRFSFRGLPQENFAVDNDDLFMKVEFFGEGGKISYDAKVRKIYPQVQTARRDLTVNGVRHLHGAEVWQTYDLFFRLPFPQVDQLRLSVGFSHGAASKNNATEFFVDDFSLARIPEPAETATPTTRPSALPINETSLLPIGGRWFYLPHPGETEIPKTFNSANSDRLLYHDAIYSSPFAGNTTAWLRAGNKDLAGNTLDKDRLVPDNVTITFDATSMIIHTHGIPNHPTGQFPGQVRGDGNPNSIQEQQETFYFPLKPTENPQHVSTAKDNSNHALHMGPIGLAANGVVFFNPFDMGNTDAADMMDRCCGHPNQDNQYHYHKYPVCINTPWSDEGADHSPLLGWAFDGYPVYGPYESANVMAKDIKGENALNDFNVHFDKDRGWHYHVTPGRFPYIIGGFWGVEDTRDAHGPRGRGPGNGPGGDRRGPPDRGGPDGRPPRPPFGPPPGN